MTSESRRKVEELFHAALGRDPAERDAFLEKACAGDDALLCEVKSLLDADGRAERFIEEPAVDAATQVASLDESPSWIGRRIQSYEVVSLLGSGGMGEVYRARDTRLGRDVALKILSEPFAESPERVARFEREARVLAALSHPNVASIHGLEESEGRHVLVLELVEGETLAERIARGPIPLAEALPLFGQIAAGLEAAHGKGIVHRDLKPANVRITPEGRVKVLDFGLAKAIAGVVAAGSDVVTPSARDPQTGEGRILGTVAYMSPEQARGQEVDKRTDVWAFGCCLYEALTGKRAFKGETVSDTFAAVLEREVDLGALPPRTPGLLRSLLRRCLEKNRDRRLRDTGDVRIELEEAEAELSQPHAMPEAAAEGLRPTATRRRVIEITAAALLVGAVGVLVGGWLTRPGTVRERPVRRFAFTPENLVSAAISPDGGRIAYVAGVPPVTTLWIQDLDQEQPRELAGTEGARRPFWSPDGEFIGFAASWDLKRIPAQGGATIVLCEMPGPHPSSLGWGDPFSGTWSPGGDSIAFSSGQARRLYEVPAQGGRPRLLIEPSQSEQGKWFVFPHYLPLEPGSRSLLLCLQRPGAGQQGAEVLVQSLETGERRVLARGVDPVYSPSGHVLYRRSRTLYALPFSPKTLNPSGEAFPIAENASGSLSLSREGTLVYVDAPPAQWQLVLRDRGGKKLGLVGQSQDAIIQPRLSPDDRQVAVAGLEGGVWDIWIHEVGRAVKTRLTFGRYTEVSHPIWSPTGDRIAFSASGDGTQDRDIFVASVAGSGEATTPAAAAGREFTGDWSPDGRYIVYGADERETANQDLWYLELKGGGGGSAPVGLLQTPFEEHLAQFSPDGRFVAYLSVESGRSEVYVQRFPEGGGKVQLSTGGACRMRWGRNGQIFYVELSGERGRKVPPSDSGTLVALPVKTTPKLSVGRPKKLFEAPGLGLTTAVSAQYDVFADGQRFVMREPVGEPPPAAIRVVENWFEEFRDQQPGSP